MKEDEVRGEKAFLLVTHLYGKTQREYVVKADTEEEAKKKFIEFCERKGEREEADNLLRNGNFIPLKLIK